MLTGLILILAVFVLGFFADPIINMYVDPWSYLTPFSSSRYDRYVYPDDERSTWYEHFAKGLASMGVLGFLKVLVASPLQFFRFGGGGRGRNTARDRYEQVSWIIILIGVGTFLVVRIRVPSTTRFILNCTRLCTKAFAHGAAGLSKEPERESWTSKVTMMMTRLSRLCDIQLQSIQAFKSPLSMPWL
jgi:hypothetical protein